MDKHVNNFSLLAEPQPYRDFVMLLPLAFKNAFSEAKNSFNPLDWLDLYCYKINKTS